MSDEFVAVIGRFTPIGERHPHGVKDCLRYAALLLSNGEPMCQTVKLERLVPDKKAEAEREFLDLTEGM